MSAVATVVALGAPLAPDTSGRGSEISSATQPQRETIRIGSWQGPIVEGDFAKNVAKVKEVIAGIRPQKLAGAAREYPR